MHAPRFEAVAPQIVKTSGFREVSGLILLRLLKIIPHCSFTLQKISNILKNRRNRTTNPHIPHHVHVKMILAVFLFFCSDFKEIIGSLSFYYIFLSLKALIPFSFILIIFGEPRSANALSYSKLSRGLEEILHISFS